MIFIPAKQSDYNRLAFTSRKSVSKRSTGSNFVARERDILLGTTRAVVNAVNQLTAEYSNTRLVYVCK